MCMHGWRGRRLTGAHASCCTVRVQEFPQDWFDGLDEEFYNATRYVATRNKYGVRVPGPPYNSDRNPSYPSSCRRCTGQRRHPLKPEALWPASRPQACSCAGEGRPGAGRLGGQGLDQAAGPPGCAPNRDFLPLHSACARATKRTPFASHLHCCLRRPWPSRMSRGVLCADSGPCAVLRSPLPAVHGSRGCQGCVCSLTRCCRAGWFHWYCRCAPGPAREQRLQATRDAQASQPESHEGAPAVHPACTAPSAQLTLRGLRRFYQVRAAGAQGP